jgi:hypothetical protein
MRVGARGIAVVAALALAAFAVAYAAASGADGEPSSRKASRELPAPAKAPETRDLERVAPLPSVIGRQPGVVADDEAPADTGADPTQPSGGYGGGYGGGGGGTSQPAPEEPADIDEESVWNPLDPPPPTGEDTGEGGATP